MMPAKPQRNILICLLALLGFGASCGGGALILLPSGKLIGGLPLAMLNKTSFSNLLVQGVLLFLFFGLTSVLFNLTLIKKNEPKLFQKINFFVDMHQSWSFSIYVAFALVIWIQTEMPIISSVQWSHSLYAAWASFIIFVALLPPLRNTFIK